MRSEPWSSFYPVSCDLGRAFELVSAGFMNHHSIVSVFSSSLDAAAVAMLGQTHIRSTRAVSGAV